MFPVLKTNTSKFQIGTRVKSKINGNSGVVTGTSFNSIYGEMEFYAKFDYVIGTVCISETDANSMWEVESPAPPPDSVTIQLPPVPPGYTYQIYRNWQPGDPADNSQNRKSCDHKWSIYHGLKETFEYCTTCDEKKKK